MDEQTLMKLRSNHTFKEISLLTNTPVSTLKKQAKRWGISKTMQDGRLYHYNTTFFKVPNPVNSYVAGLVGADGMVRHVPGRKDSLVLALQERDKSFLEGIKSMIGYSGQLTKTRGSRKIVGGVESSNQDMYYLTITSCQDLVDDLRTNFNITPKKTHSLKFPSHLTSLNKLCYLIGYIDGDGTIYRERYVSRITVYCQHQFAEELKDFLEGEFKLELPKISQVNNLSRVRFSREDILNKLTSIINEYSLPVMERKWQKLL